MKLIYNIGLLVGIQPEGVLRVEGEEQGRTGVLENAWLRIEDGRIAAFGPMDSVILSGSEESVDARGGMVMPGFCDSHTHVVYAGSRDGEFLDKINGLSYEEIAARGGGILNSADLLHRTSEEELYSQSLPRVQEMMEKGTVALEIKSGYGLNPAVFVAEPGILQEAGAPLRLSFHPKDPLLLDARQKAYIIDKTHSG